MRREFRWVWGIVLLFLAGCATVEVWEIRVVSGVVTDSAGQPVAGSPVLVAGRRLELAMPEMAYVERGRREVRGVTDAAGRYRIEFDAGILGNNFFLFFHDEQGFDRVRFAQPDPVEITERLKASRELRISMVLRPNPAWPEVERQMAYYGPATDRGKILRRHGLPGRRETARVGEEALDVWWYPEDGVSYSFSQDRLVSTQNFPPVRGGR